MYFMHILERNVDSTYFFTRARYRASIYLSFSMDPLDKVIHIAHVTAPERRRDVSPVWCFELERGYVPQREFRGVDDFLWLRIW
jgi:hypothetical protein